MRRLVGADGQRPGRRPGFSGRDQYADHHDPPAGPGAARVCLTERVPRNHGDNLTLLAAIGTSQVTAPLVFPRALDGAVLRQWVREWLVPQLRPGQIVVQDNLSVHKDARARAAIEAAGCQLAFLPTYSPDLNPIELLFAKVKAVVRGAKARTPEAVRTALGTALDRVTPAELTASYRHCGYAVSGQPL